MSNEILDLCPGYSQIYNNDDFGKALAPFYTEKHKIRKVAESWKMIHKSQSKIAVLCCHGYAGTPGELTGVGLQLYNNGFDIYCPRLPGHGTKAKEFKKSKAKSWIDIEIVAYQYLMDNYDEVYIVGHSMGGLIAVIIAQIFRVKKIALIGPAFDIFGLDTSFKRTKVKLSSIVNYSYDIPWATDKSYYGICERDDDDDIWLGRELWSHVFSKPLVQLLKIRGIAIKNLRKLDTDVLIIRGTSDLLVKREVLNRFKINCKKNLKIMEIEGAGHFVLYEPTKDYANQCNQGVVNWLLDNAF